MNSSEFNAIIQSGSAPADGIVPRTPDPEYRSLKLDTTTGDFFFYGETAGSASPGGQIPAFVGVVTAIYIARHGQAGQRGGNAWEGDRPYLVLQVAINPLLTYSLRLPVGRAQWHYRSLLGSLLSLPSLAQPLKFQGNPGDRGACFIQVLRYSPTTHTEELIRDPAIGGTDQELHLAVNTIQHRLGHPAQFIDNVDPTSSHILEAAHDS